MSALPRIITVPADFQGIGYALADLACLYQGQEVLTRSDNRLWLALEALRGNQTLPPTPVSGKQTHTHAAAMQKRCSLHQALKLFASYGVRQQCYAAHDMAGVA